jgi:DUF4097 and DUF4098 domain-containing protein YvlB
MKAVNITAAVLLLTATSAWAEQTVDRTLPADPTATVHIENLAGSVEIIGWDRNEVHVTGTLGDDVEELEFTSDGDDIEIVVQLPDSSSGRWHGESRINADADLRVQVPKASDIEVETVSAFIKASEVSGSLELESVSGEILVSGNPSDVEAESVSGTIRVKGSNTVVEAASVSGSVYLEGVAGSVEAGSVSGNVAVEAETLDDGEFETVSGSIKFTGSLSSGAHLDAESHSGNVTLELPGTTAASFSVETFSGQIESDFGPQATRTSKHHPGKSLRFSTGNGQARVVVETFSGSVRLKKR